MGAKTLPCNDAKTMNQVRRRGRQAEYHSSKINRKEGIMRRAETKLGKRKERWEERREYNTVVFQSKWRINKVKYSMYDKLKSLRYIF